MFPIPQYGPYGAQNLPVSDLTNLPVGPTNLPIGSSQGLPIGPIQPPVSALNMPISAQNLPVSGLNQGVPVGLNQGLPPQFPQRPVDVPLPGLQHGALAGAPLLQQALQQSGIVPNPASAAQQVRATDQAHAEGVVAHLMSAISAARDPELKTSLATALAALQKHVAGIHKEHQQMLAGKVSPRLMHEAYSNGPAHSPGSVL